MTEHVAGGTSPVRTLDDPLDGPPPRRESVIEGKFTRVQESPEEVFGSLPQRRRMFQLSGPARQLLGCRRPAERAHVEILDDLVGLRIQLEEVGEIPVQARDLALD